MNIPPAKAAGALAGSLKLSAIIPGIKDGYPAWHYCQLFEVVCVKISEVVPGRSVEISEVVRCFTKQSRWRKDRTIEVLHEVIRTKMV